MSHSTIVPFPLGPMPSEFAMAAVDERTVRAPLPSIFALAADVASWPVHLSHYRYVRFHARASDQGGLVEMSANRPFGPLSWPTWWTSQMAVRAPGTSPAPHIRFRHVAGITKGMEVEWQFASVAAGTHVRIVHLWNGPRWPLIGELAARAVIGPVFVHGIAWRTLEGLARVAERLASEPEQQRGSE